MFRVLCFERRVVTVEYFMDEMEMYEINTIIKDLKYVDRNQREIDRFGIYVNMQANTKAKVNIEDYMPLPWDEEKNTGTKVDEQQAEEFKNRMKQLEHIVQNSTMVQLGNGEFLKK